MDALVQPQIIILGRLTIVVKRFLVWVTLGDDHSHDDILKT